MGPLPPSNGFIYLLTCVDCFTRAAKAITMADITAETVANTFVAGWVVRFGVPFVISTDRGGHFQSQFWQQLVWLLEPNEFGQPPIIPLQTVCWNDSIAN